MEQSTITALLTALLSAATVIFVTWYKDYLSKKGKSKISIEDKSMFYLEMDKTCSVIRKSLNADGAYLAYFHNGGSFANGITMDKFTVVGEDYNEFIRCQSYKKVYYATMINYVSYAYHRLLLDNRYYISNVDDSPDLSYKNDLIKRKVTSAYMFLIKDPITDKPIGFFVIEYISKYDMTKVDEVEIWKHQNNLSKLLNMTVLT